MTYLDFLFFLEFTNIKNNIHDFNNKFSKYTYNYTLLVIFHIPNQQQNHIFTYNDNIHFLELHTLSSSGGVEFDNNNGAYRFFIKL
jgi:hypothetical protein